MLDPQGNGFQMLHSCSSDGELRVWNLDTDSGEEVRKAAAALAKKHAEVQAHAGGDRMAVKPSPSPQASGGGGGDGGGDADGGNQKKKEEEEASPPECADELPGHKGSTSCVCVSRGGNLVVSGGADRTLKVWSYFEGKARLQQVVGPNKSKVKLQLH